MTSTIDSGFDLPDCLTTDNNDKPQLIYTSACGYCCIYTSVSQGRRVVIKAIKPELHGNRIYRDLLDKEYNIASKLYHPGIVSTIGLLDIDHIGQSIIMEYVDGIKLSDYIEKHSPLSTETALSIISKLCDSLSYMHSHGVVHRDLKPDNIMITHDGRYTKIIDFGLSDTSAFVDLKYAGGTRKYGAPEQFTPGRIVDHRADIYALGKIMSDLLPKGPSRIMKLARQCRSVSPDDRPDDAAFIRERLSKAKASTSRALLTIAVAATCLATGFFINKFLETGHNSTNSTESARDVQYQHKADSLINVARKYTRESLTEAYNSSKKDSTDNLSLLPNRIIRNLEKEVEQQCDSAEANMLKAKIVEAATQEMRDFFNRHRSEDGSLNFK